MPRISVIVPVYKVEKYIHRCVDSILAQTFTDFELILVDDGSPDNCSAICDEYSSKDRRIRVIHQKNSGLSAARNVGIDWVFANSDSQWITFVDSDDWISQYYLDVLYRAAYESGALISVGNHCFVESEEHEHIESAVDAYWLVLPEDFKVQETRRFNFAWAKLYHRSCFENVRYPNGKNYEDVFTTYKLIFNCREIAVADVVIYYYFKNPDSITQSLWVPSELVILDGVQQQMQFYKDNSFTRAYEVEEKRLLWNYAYQIQRIRNSGLNWASKQSYLAPLKREMMRYIRNSNGRYTFANVRHCFEAAYPTAMGIYNHLAALYRRTKR